MLGEDIDTDAFLSGILSLVTSCAAAGAGPVQLERRISDPGRGSEWASSMVEMPNRRMTGVASSWGAHDFMRSARAAGNQAYSTKSG